MSLTDLLWNVGAIVSVIPAVYVYKGHGLLLALGIYAGSVLIFAVLAVLMLWLWSVFVKSLGPR